MAALPDIIGQTIGGSVADALAGKPAPAPVRRSAAPAAVAAQSGMTAYISETTGLSAAQQQIIYDRQYSLGEFADGQSATWGPPSGEFASPQRNGLFQTFTNALDYNGDGRVSLGDATSAISDGYERLGASLKAAQNYILGHETIVVTGSRSKTPAVSQPFTYRHVDANYLLSQYRPGSPNQWAGAPYAMNVSKADVALMTARLHSVPVFNQPGFGALRAASPTAPTPRIATSDAIGYAGDAYDIAVRPTVDFTANVFMNDPDRVLRGARVVGHAFPVAEGTARYWENSREGHSMFASVTGAMNSTIIPVSAGASAGFVVGGLGLDGWGAIPGTVVGAYVGYKYGDELNAQGMTAAEYFQSGQANADVTRHVLATRDSTGMSLSELLDNAFKPRRGDGF
jgi:hypothetical protein